MTSVLAAVLLFGTLTAASSLAAASNTAVTVTNTPATVLDAWSSTNHDVFTIASCSSPGNCAAVGYDFAYAPGVNSQPILVSEIGGHWGKVMQVATDLNTANIGSLVSVSCESTGNCVAVGSYEAVDNQIGSDPLIVTETNGVWDSGFTPTVSGAPYDFGSLTSVSCSSLGNCTAVGSFDETAMSITMTNGVWAPAVDVAINDGQGALAQGGSFTSIACTAPSQCAAVGGYDVEDATGYRVVNFVASLADGTWTTYGEVGAALTPQGLTTSLVSVACSSAGNCAAVGYADNNTRDVFRPDPIPLGVTETNGIWGQGVELAHSLNTKHWGQLGAISCVPNGECVAVGYYYGSEKFVTELGVIETNGSWSAGSAIDPSVSLGYPGNETWEVSCVASGHCFALFDSFAPIKHEHAAYSYPMFTELVGKKWIDPTVIGENLVPPGQQNSPSTKFSLKNKATALSCTTDTSCTAIGSTMFNENKHTQLDAWVATPN
jgi:hypothetical protein